MSSISMFGIFDKSQIASVQKLADCNKDMLSPTMRYRWQGLTLGAPAHPRVAYPDLRPTLIHRMHMALPFKQPICLINHFLYSSLYHEGVDSILAIPIGLCVMDNLGVWVAIFLHQKGGCQRSNFSFPLLKGSQRWSKMYRPMAAPLASHGSNGASMVLQICSGS